MDTPAEVRIYALDGRFVRELEGQRQPDGFWLFTWSGQGQGETLVPPGIYLCRIDVNAQASSDAFAQAISVAY